MLRRLLLVLPAVAVGIVLWAVLSTGWPAPVLIARVVGGPTLGTTSLSWRLSVQRLSAERLEPSPGLDVRVSVDSGSERAVWAGTTDGAGEVEAVLRLTRPLAGAAHVRVEASEGQLLAVGDVELDDKTWRQGARRQSLWVPGRQQGELWLRVSPMEGTFAVPFTSELLIEVTGGATHREPAPGAVSAYQGIAGVTLEAELSGAERSDPTAPLRTDENGRVRLGLRPQEHAILLQLRARTPAEGVAVGQDEPAGLRFQPHADSSPSTGEWFGALPVTPGALHAALDGTRLIVRSPIPRERAYVSLVDEQHRLAGYTLALAPDAEGGASASVQLDSELLAHSPELYAVVSSEPDKRSAGTVGWQLKRAVASDLARTFDVADQLLLDGREGVLLRERAARLARRSVAATLLSLVGVGMVATFALEARRSARRAAAAPAELSLGSQRWWLALSLGCLLLGIGALAYFGLAQR